MAQHATTEGTRQYTARFAEARSLGHFRQAQGLWMSSIGIGTYLGAEDESTDRGYIEATTEALRGGINVIDSAVSYRSQRSERNIGVALRTVIQDQQLARDEVVVCTKGGYVPMDSDYRGDPRSYMRERFIDTGVIDKPETDLVDGIHCMTPRYLKEQVQLSLKNLGVDCIDIYYIHNPEAQLPSVDADSFYDRIEKAFAGLEEEARAGRIQYYGAATWNGFRLAPSSEEHLDLSRMVQAAERAGGPEHRFKFVQLPINLAMMEALSKDTQQTSEGTVPLLEAAAEFGLRVVASASLLQGRLCKGLPMSLRDRMPQVGSDALMALQFARALPLTTALVGMGQPKHVRENLGLLRMPPKLPREE